MVIAQKKETKSVIKSINSHSILTKLVLLADVEFLVFKPSIISAAALLSASQELLPMQHSSFLKALSNCSYVNKVNTVSQLLSSPKR